MQRGYGGSSDSRLKYESVDALSAYRMWNGQTVLNLSPSELTSEAARKGISTLRASISDAHVEQCTGQSATPNLETPPTSPTVSGDPLAPTPAAVKSTEHGTLRVFHIHFQHLIYTPSTTTTTLTSPPTQPLELSRHCNHQPQE